MQIKGVYDEKKYKEEKDKQYGQKVILTGTAGKYLKETQKEKIPHYAFRPKKSPEQVKDDFLIALKSAKASEDFYNSASKTIRVTRQYFTVYYIDVHSLPESHLTSTKHYKPSGEYTIDGKLEGDTLKVDISQGSTYSHTSYDVVTTRKTINKKDYYSYTYLEDFSQNLYNTTAVDESSLISAEEIMQDQMFDPGKPSYILGSDASYELLQVLLFPVWRVECDFNEHTYVNYVSDVSQSKVVYLELSQEEQKRLAEEKYQEQLKEQHKKQQQEKEKKILGSMCKSFGITFVISLLVHLFTNKVASKGLGYCGFLIAHLGTFGGLITTILCGFGVIGIILGIIALIKNTKAYKLSLSLYITADCIIILDIILYIISIILHIGIINVL